MEQKKELMRRMSLMMSRCSELVSIDCTVWPDEAVEVRVVVLALEVAEALLLGEQRLRALHVAVEEHRQAQAQVRHQLLVQLR